MAVSISKPALNLRELLAKLVRVKFIEEQTFFFSGDAVATDFALEKGWKPSLVFVNGALMRPGSGEDYMIEFDGFVYIVSFAVAPAAVDIGIQAKGEQG